MSIYRYAIEIKDLRECDHCSGYSLKKKNKRKQGGEGRGRRMKKKSEINTKENQRNKTKQRPDKTTPYTTLLHYSL